MHRNLKAMLVYVLMFSFAMNTFRIYYPYYLAEKGLPLNTIGGLTGIGLLASAIALPLAGALIDTVGRKPVILMTSLMITVASLIALAPLSLPLVVLALFFFYTAFVTGNPARSSLIADSVPPERLGAAFGLIATFFSISRVLSPYPAGLIAERMGYARLFSLILVLALASLVFAAIAFKETLPDRRLPHPSELRARLIETVKVHPRERTVIEFMIMDRIAWSLWFPLLTPYLKVAYGLEPAEVGVLMTLVDVVGVFTQYGVGIAADRIGALKPLMLSEVAGITIGTLMYVGLPKNLLPVAMVLLGIAISSWIPAYNTLLSRISPSPGERGRLFAKSNFYRTIVGSPSSGLGGWMFSHIGLGSPFATSAVLLTMVVVRYYPRLKRETNGGRPTIVHIPEK